MAEDTPRKHSTDGLKKAILFNVSGAIGTFFFYQLYAAIQSVTESASIAWPVSYGASIVWQHLLHRLIVFGSEKPYLSSLVKTYIAYFIGLLLSSALMPVLEYITPSPTISWLANLAFTGVVNYFTVKKAFE